jgi:hypothetical protein
VFNNETKQAARGRALKALAAAASLAVMAIATHASAETFTLVSDSMNTTYTAHVWDNGNNEDAYDNGVTFQVSGYNVPPTSSLFGFCIDIYHNIGLGGLNLLYSSNQDTGGGLVPNSGTTLNGAQIIAITDLVDTGFKLHEQTPNDADTIMRLAAIQAAIWAVEVPFTLVNNVETPTVTLDNPNATVTPGGTTIGQYFTDYTTGAYDHLEGPNDKVFTISNGDNQSFAIGWPIAGGVPEPASWAMMLTGFFGMGAVLRNRRKWATAAI